VAPFLNVQKLSGGFGVYDTPRTKQSPVLSVELQVQVWAGLRGGGDPPATAGGTDLIAKARTGKSRLAVKTAEQFLKQ
jgi:hypothetical protein